jgi:hypothetical protein
MATTTKPTTKPQAPTEAELSAQVEADIEARIETEIAAGLAADRAKRRAELFYAARRKIEAAHYDKINAKAPIENQYSGLTREQHEARLREMRRRAAEDMRAMDEAEARGRARVAAMRGPRASIGPGSEGFEIKRPGS